MIIYLLCFGLVALVATYYIYVKLDEKAIKEARHRNHVRSGPPGPVTPGIPKAPTLGKTPDELEKPRLASKKRRTKRWKRNAFKKSRINSRNQAKK